jgi:hypothetical protein
MIVADASAALSALLNAGPARRVLGTDQLHVPHLIDAEVANGLRRWRHLGMPAPPWEPLPHHGGPTLKQRRADAHPRVPERICPRQPAPHLGR